VEWSGVEWSGGEGRGGEVRSAEPEIDADAARPSLYSPPPSADDRARHAASSRRKASMRGYLGRRSASQPTTLRPGPCAHACAYQVLYPAGIPVCPPQFPSRPRSQPESPWEIRFPLVYTATAGRTVADGECWTLPAASTLRAFTLSMRMCVEQGRPEGQESPRCWLADISAQARSTPSSAAPRRQDPEAR